MVLGSILAGAAGGATVSIVISAIDNFSRTFNKAAAGTAALGTALTAVGVAGAVAVGGLIKMAGQFEQTQIAFTTMLGSAEAAKKLLDDLADFAARTPFTIPGIEQNAKLLLGMGVAAEDMIPTLKSLGDIAAGLNVPMGRLALNFGQVKVQGKLTGRELRDFAVAGVPLVSELAKNLNLAEKEIAAMVSRGEIGFKEVEEAFTSMTGEGGRFFDLMDAQSKTFLGQVSNIQDSFIRIGRAMGTVFLPAAKAVAEKLAVIVGWFEKHPTIAKYALIALAVATAFALIVGPLLIMIALLPSLILGFAALSTVTLPITLTVLAVAAAIFALIAAFTILAVNWDKFGTKTKILLAILFPFITLPVLIIKEWDNLKIGMAMIWNGIVTIIGKGANKVIDIMNRVLGSKLFKKAAKKLGFGDLTIKNIDVSKGLIDIDAMKRLRDETEETTKAISKQVDVVSKEAELLTKLAGFKLIRGTGDIFDPKNFRQSEFQTKNAFEIAKRGGGVNISIENVIGLDPEEISKALSDELNNKVSL